MPTFTWSSGVTANAYLSGAGLSVYTPGLGGFPQGNADDQGNRRVYVSGVGADSASGVTPYLSFGGGYIGPGSMLVNPSSAFTFHCVAVGGSSVIGYNGTGGTTYFSWGSTFTGSIPGWANWHTVPGRVATPTITSNATGALTVMWTQPDTGDSAMTGYRVQIGTDTGLVTDMVRANLGPTVRSHTFTGLIPGVTYYCRVVARNAISDTAGGRFGAWSNTVNARTMSGVRVGVSGAWKQASAFVGVNGVWKATEIRAGASGAWKGMAS